MQTITRLVSDRVLKILGYALFALWLATWVYTASKMLAFTSIGYRAITTLASILFLNLWAGTFAVLAYKRFTTENSPMEATLSSVYSPGMASFLRRATWLTPLVFSGFIAVIYLSMTLFTSTAASNSPSPALPAVVTFSPMVFFFAGSSWRTRNFQDNLAAKSRRPLGPQDSQQPD